MKHKISYNVCDEVNEVKGSIYTDLFSTSSNKLVNVKVW